MKASATGWKVKWRRAKRGARAKAQRTKDALAHFFRSIYGRLTGTRRRRKHRLPPGI